MVASLFELDGSFTIEATLPAGFFSYPDELLGGCVLGAFPGSVPFVVTETAYFRLAPLTDSELPSVIRTTALIFVNMIWFDEGATTASRAIDTVFGSVFQVFAIPILFKFVVE